MSDAMTTAIAERHEARDDKCPDCDGEGKIIGYSLFTGEKLANMLCPTCEGSGKQETGNAY